MEAQRQCHNFKEKYQGRQAYFSAADQKLAMKKEKAHGGQAAP